MGFVTDNMKILDWVESEAPLFVLPSLRARERLAEFAIETLARSAEIAGYLLRSALRDCFDADAGKTLVAPGYERFWIDTQDDFFDRLAAAARRYADATSDAEARHVETGDLARVWLDRTLRLRALAIFEATAPVDALSDLEDAQVARIVAAAKSLHLGLAGYGKIGAQLFTALDLPTPEPTSKRKAAEGAVA